MSDREKVINELNDCLENQHIEFMDGVGDIYAVSEETIRNVIALLKEQEAVKPFIQISEHTGRKWLTCGACGYPIESEKDSWEEVNFCPKCGRPVLWEGR